jgi:hypothetical protein
MDKINKLFGLLTYDQYLENPLSIAQNTIITFPKQHPNLNLTP